MKFVEIVNKDHKFGEPDKYFKIDDSIHVELEDGKIIDLGIPGLLLTGDELHKIVNRARKNLEDFEEEPSWWSRLFG